MSLETICENEIKNTFNYIVDYISAKRVGLNGKTEYLVKWEGWSGRESTWETADQFASQQVIDIFETGLERQMTGRSQLSLIQNRNHGLQKKCKISGKPVNAYKLLEKYRKQHIKSAKKDLKFNDKQIEVFKSPLKKSVTDGNSQTHKLKTINEYEKMMGSAKRKSRMSWPSVGTTRLSKSGHSLKTDRSQRYERRQKTPNGCLNQSFVSNESNESLEENKNPQLIDNSMTLESSHSYNSSELANNDINKSLFIENNKNVNQNSVAIETSPQSIQPTDSPTKLFLKKIKQRYENNPEIYTQFLNHIIDFNDSKIELNKLLGNQEELIKELFNILIINRKSRINRKANNSSPLKSDEEINEEINKWLQKFDQCLKAEQKINFWDYLKNKSYDSILNASPDHLWLRIDNLLQNHKDLKEEFKKFMPNLCSKPYLVSKDQ